MTQRFKKGESSSERASSIQKAGKSIVAAAPQRSKSVYSNIKTDSKKQGAVGSVNKPKSATAFGRRADAPPAKPEPKPKEVPKSFVEYAAQGLSRVPEKSKKGALNKPMLGMGSRAGKDNSRAVRREDADVQGSVRGISKLQLGVQGNRGPVIVNHDDDYDADHREPVVGGLRALQQKISKSKPTRFSMSDSNSELEGVSEHLYTRGDEDQLDKLLVQAKKTRAVGFDNDY